MSTGAIIAIIAAVVIVAALVLIAMPRLRAAREERAEAELHASRAEMHDRGLADDELGRNGYMPPAPEAPGRDRETTSSEERPPVR